MARSYVSATLHQGLEWARRVITNVALARKFVREMNKLDPVTRVKRGVAVPQAKGRRA